MDPLSDDDRRIERALRTADQTRMLRIERGVRHRAASLFRDLFGSRPALIVADVNTFAAAGRDVADSFRGASHPCRPPHIFTEPEPIAEYEHALTLKEVLASHDAIPVAVGSGTINDLVKLVSHELGRPYLVLATAASMDGYSAFGASIIRGGAKQTLACPAPVGILADLEVIESAPAMLNAAGYADLLAKTVAGADWIVADALQVESIDATAWEMMHGRLRDWIANPHGVRQRDPDAIRKLLIGLLMSGLVMQRTKSSRAASGAEHQFSHLWDMQGHLFPGKMPSHGFKVAIGTLASSALYEEILSQRLEDLDVERAASCWKPLDSIEADIEKRFDRPELKAKAIQEIREKFVGAEEIREQLVRLQIGWPQLRQRLRSHLPDFDELRSRLAAAGCPTNPSQIGVPPSRLRESYHQAYYVRRRFTVLDLAVRTGLLERWLENIFKPGGRWPNDRECVASNWACG